jgi:hypothetical protein
MAGFYELQQSRVDTHARIDGLLEALERELRSRDQWESAIRGWV